ncbi:hypothetical protein MRX96_004253 [Rhipicephalus microplus]
MGRTWARVRHGDGRAPRHRCCRGLCCVRLGGAVLLPLRACGFLFLGAGAVAIVVGTFGEVPMLPSELPSVGRGVARACEVAAMFLARRDVSSAAVGSSFCERTRFHEAMAVSTSSVVSSAGTPGVLSLLAVVEKAGATWWEEVELASCACC